MKRYVVILGGDREQIVLGPLATRKLALDLAVEKVVEHGLDTFNSPEMIREGIACNGRNDAAIGVLMDPRTPLKAG